MLRCGLNLDALRARCAEEAARELEAAANTVCAEAKALCPVETGRLRESVHVRAENEKRVVFTDCEYAAAVEFGTSRRSAQPFLSRAAEMERGRRG